MRRLLSMTLALAATALAAGCGGGSTSSDQASSTRPASSSTTTQQTASTQSTAPGAKTAKSSVKAEVARLLVRVCRNRVQAAPALTTPQKEEVEKLCGKAANGVAAARETAQEVCREIITRSAQPGSPMTAAREQALAACKNEK
jgi:hypothetical protein